MTSDPHFFFYLNISGQGHKPFSLLPVRSITINI